MKNPKEKSNDKFPGYPHYDKNEDIYENEDEVEIDPEKINVNVPASFKNKKKPPETDLLMELPIPKNIIDDEDEIPEEESDLDEDDLLALGDIDEDQDGGEDELFKKDRIYPVDMTGGDLDIPGTDEDDLDELNGEEDEENNLYSEPD